MMMIRNARHAAVAEAFPLVPKVKLASPTRPRRAVTRRRIAPVFVFT